MNDQHPLSCQEDENAQEPPRLSENKTVKGPDGSMYEIKTDSTENEWIDIGGVKNWVRWCPECKNVIFHREKRRCQRQIKTGARCYRCSLKFRRNCGRPRHSHQKTIVTIDDLTRKCPKCQCNVVYTNKGNRNNAEKLKRLCKMCIAKSKRIYDTPDRLVRNCPRCGKEIEYVKGKDLSVRRTRWLRDNRENRLCRKCSVSNENNPMYGSCRTGKDNPNYGKRWSDEKRDRMRKYWIGEFKNRWNRFVNYNPTAYIYFDKLSLEMGWKLQHAENGGEVIVEGYFLDAYDREKNIVVEYDEKYHFYKKSLRTKDVDRMRKIIDHLGCKFFRYNSITGVLNEYN